MVTPRMNTVVPKLCYFADGVFSWFVRSYYINLTHQALFLEHTCVPIQNLPREAQRELLVAKALALFSGAKAL